MEFHKFSISLVHFLFLHISGNGVGGAVVAAAAAAGVTFQNNFLFQKYKTAKTCIAIE